MYNTIKCIIAETDNTSAKLLTEQIQYISNCSVEASFINAKKTMDYLNKHIVDIAIVNIDLPELNNYDFVNQLKNRPKIIAISSNPDSAIEGYNYRISNYLLKPFSQTQLSIAINNTVENPASSNFHLTTEPKHKFIFIRAEYKLMKIDFDNILYIEGLKDYSKIYTTTAGKAIITLQNLKSFEEKLSADDFIRVHRSYIVSLSKIDVIHKNSILIGKNEIPISDGFRNHLHSMISKYI